jgi:hypothetical protein
MSTVTARQMIAAEILKLRRNRSLMMAVLVLAPGMVALYFAALELRHNGQLGGAQGLSDGTTLLGLYFGSFASILIGTVAGTTDLTSGVFRDLAATGRSRLALFLVRVPAAIAVALTAAGSGFVLTVAAAIIWHGPTPVPGPGLILEFAAWLVLATTVVTTLAVGVASLTGSRALTLTAVIGWQTIATQLLFAARFLGGARDAVLMVALSYLRPGASTGSPGHPGSPNALPADGLPMAAAVAVLVLVAWMVIPAVAGAWRTRSRDA